MEATETAANQWMLHMDLDLRLAAIVLLVTGIEYWDQMGSGKILSISICKDGDFKAIGSRCHSWTLVHSGQLIRFVRFST